MSFDLEMILGHAMVVALWLWSVAQLVLVITLVSARRAAKARAALGKPTTSVEALREGEVMTLSGRLIGRESESLEGPDGAPALLVTLRGEGPHRAFGETRVAAKLVLALADGTKVAIEGDCQVETGERETSRQRFGRLSRAWRARIEKLVGEVAPTTLARVLWVRADTPLRIRGSLARRASAEGEGYRDDAAEWTLSPPSDREPVKIAAEHRPRVVFFARQVLPWAVLTAALLFGLVPFAVEATCEREADAGNDTLRDCDPTGFDALGRAHRAAVVLAAFPGWYDRGLRARRGVAYSALNGVDVCRGPSASLVEGAAARANAILMGLPPETDETASALETLARFYIAYGRASALVEAAREWPVTTRLGDRARAHLEAGDLEGALALARRPGGTSDYSEQSVRAHLLCLAGDFEASEARFDEVTRAVASLHGLRHRASMDRAECRRAAGDPSGVSRLLETLPEERRDTAAHLLVEAHLIAGDPEAALGAASQDPESETPRMQLAILSSLIALDRDADALRRFERSRDLRWALVRTTLDPRVYSEPFLPTLDEGQLARLAERFEALAERTPDEDDVGPEADDRGERARRAAAELLASVGLRRGLRWSPEAEPALARAEALLAEDDEARARVRAIRAGLELLRGERDAVDSHPMLASLQDEVSAPVEGPESEHAWSSYVAVPRAGAILAARRIVEGPGSPEERHERLRQRSGSASIRLGSQLLYLTQQIVHARTLGVDPVPLEAQLAAVREIFEGADPYLFDRAP